jgi:hypothetical protein
METRNRLTIRGRKGVILHAEGLLAIWAAWSLRLVKWGGPLLLALLSLPLLR